MSKLLSLLLCFALSITAAADPAPTADEVFGKIEKSSVDQVKELLNSIEHLKIRIDWERFQNDPEYQEEIASILIDAAKQMQARADGQDWTDFDGMAICLGSGYQKGYGLWTAACVDPIDVSYISYQKPLWPQIADRIIIATEWSFGIQIGVEAGVYVLVRHGFPGEWAHSRKKMNELLFVGVQGGVRLFGGVGAKALTAIGYPGNILSFGKTVGVGAKASVSFMWYWSLGQVLKIYDTLFNYFGVKNEEAEQTAFQIEEGAIVAP